MRGKTKHGTLDSEKRKQKEENVSDLVLMVGLPAEKVIWGEEDKQCQFLLRKLNLNDSIYATAGPFPLHL